MDYKPDERALSARLLERLEQQIGILNDASMTMRHHVYKSDNYRPQMPRYELFRQIKFLLKDMEFTTIFLEQEIVEEENRAK